VNAPTLPSSDRRRRRRLRLIPIIGYTVIALALAYFFEQRQSTTVIFVRHADTDASMAGPDNDAPLSARGRQRAELLADFMQNIDVVAGPNAIYASDKRRTQETAAPLAKRLNIPVQIDDHLDTEGFMDRVLDDHAGDIVLIVSHSNTIAPLIDELHGSKNLRPFAENDFNRVYIVTIPRPLGKVKTLELFYQDPPAETPAAPPPAEAPAAEPSTSASDGK
jgi:broad specificity phosphatase PhoE